jgi:DNA repair ATPase RecN
MILKTKLTTMKLKNRFLQLGALFILLTVASCSGGKKQDLDNRAIEPEKLQGMEQNESTTGMHKQHNNLAENFPHKNIVILDEVYPVNKQTQAELEEVIDAYLLVKNALVNGDVAATNKTINIMLGNIKAVKPEKLDGEGLDAWKDHISLYQDKLKEMQHVKGLGDKRSYFSHISEIMYCTIKSFGLKEGDLFAVYCPMAFDGKGAYWIAESKTIQNPYFGDKMPTCGEIKEEL